MVVPQRLIESNRIAGTTTIYPPQPDIDAMKKSGRGTIGVVKLCVDERGVPSLVEVVRSTGYGGYDLKIATTLAEWRYRPYLLQEKPVPFCTRVTFIYRPPRPARPR